MNRAARRTIVLLLVLAGCRTATHLRPAPPGGSLPVLRGRVSHAPADPVTNRCVPDVDRAMTRISRTGRSLSVDLAGAPPLGRFTNHAQGIARLPGPDGVLVVSRSGAGIGALIARVADHSDEDGEASAGAVVSTIASPADADHGGGIQALGNLLFVPYEDRGERARVTLYDVADAQAARALYELDRTSGPFPYPGNASNVAAARLDDGRILLIVGAHSSRSLDFYVSNQATPGEAAFRLTWFASLQREVPSSFQTTGLLTQCDGTLFLVGAWNTRMPPPSGGSDLLAWYRLDHRNDGAPRLAEVGRAHMECERCNFAAGAGPYVTGTGEVRLYAVAHDDADGAIVIEEFLPKGAGADN